MSGSGRMDRGRRGMAPVVGTTGGMALGREQWLVEEEGSRGVGEWAGTEKKEKGKEKKKKEERKREKEKEIKTRKRKRRRRAGPGGFGPDHTFEVSVYFILFSFLFKLSLNSIFYFFKKGMARELLLLH